MKLANIKMKRNYLIIFFIVLIAIILICAFILASKDEKLVNIKTDDVTSITIAEWKGQTITINDRNTINEIINYLESQKLKQGFLYFSNLDTWNFRIGIYGTFNNSSSIMKESFYLNYNGNVYKNNFKYTLSGFDYNYFIGLIKNSE